MKVLGFESSCDETGVALVRTRRAARRELLADALHSQVAMHAGLRRRGARAGLARPHPPRAAAGPAGAGRGRRALADVDLVAYTRGPGLAGALLVGAGVAWRWRQRWASRRWACTTWKGTCCRPSWPTRPEFPFVALLVSGGHTQLMRVDGVGRTRCWARPSTTPPARPSTRAPSCWAWAIRAGRRWRGWPARPDPAPLRCRGRCCTAATSTFRSPA
jgi:N6-L-threonylcarbamoyladenine synthase